MPEEKKGKRAFRAVVKGRVQGVGFRISTQQVARRHDLRGYVRNLSDGNVEVYAEGSSGNLKELSRFLHRGPRMAWVRDVDLNYTEPKNRHTDFSIAY